MTRRRLAAAAGAVIATASISAIAAALVLGVRGTPGLQPLSVSDVFFTVAIGSYSVAAVAVIGRRALNPVGWYLAGAGAIYGLGLLAWQIGVAGYAVHGAREPSEEVWLAWAGSWATQLAPIPLLLGLVRFPDGRVASRRLAWVGPTIAVIGVTVVMARALRPGRLGGLGPMNPVGAGGLRFLGSVGSASNAILLVAVLLVIATLVARYRASEAAVRQQLKWLMVGAAVFPIGVGAGTALGAGAAAGSIREVVSGVLFSLGLIGVPLGIAVAMVRHHLYDVDLLISRGLVYLALAIGTTVIYVGFVVGAGYWLSGSSPNLLLSILATALIALVFQPARLRLQAMANRLVYGRRVSPHEALGEFVGRVAAAYEPERLVIEMARSVGEGTVAEEVQVWLVADGGDLRALAVWPAGPPPDRLPSEAGWQSIDIDHRGERLGVINVRSGPGQPIPPAELAMIRNLALHAGLAVRNAQLTAELRQRLRELEASRHRLVSAQATERRRIERDLHDGAQQHLVALRLNLLTLAEGGAPRAPQLLEEVDAALSDLRELARGIHPAVLSDRGLGAALESAARPAPVDVRIEGGGIGRLDGDLEATVYFCCIEALQNAYKHAGAAHIWVRLACVGDRLTFAVEDDGRGIPMPVTRPGSGLQNMFDRAAAYGGRCEVRAGPKGGTVVEGWVPLARPGSELPGDVTPDAAFRAGR